MRIWSSGPPNPNRAIDPVRGSASLSVAQNEARPSLVDNASVMRSAGAFTLTARAIGAAMVRVLLGWGDAHGWASVAATGDATAAGQAGVPLWSLRHQTPRKGAGRPLPGSDGVITYVHDN